MLWSPAISSVAADSDPDGKELPLTTKAGWTNATTELQKQQRDFNFAAQSGFLDVVTVWANEQWLATH